MPEPLALYVHWPFCQAKCPYCDFNSHVTASVDHARWAAAMVTRLKEYAERLPDRTLTSIFFGGGTPSLMEPSTVEAVIETAGQLWTLDPSIEITMEANPTSVEADRFQSFAIAGVNRVSVGVQSLNDADLRTLGRLHSADEALSAVDVAMKTFKRVSFDLIYARQKQTIDEWQAELARAIAVGTDHLSLYQLTIEPGTAFGARFERGTLRGLPDEDLSADLFILTQEMTEAAGLPRYEVSNHARPGSQSRHNLTYWRGGDWVGVGPGAHGRFDDEGARVTTEAVASPALWLQRVEEGLPDTENTIAPDEEAEIRLMMGLRLTEGVDAKHHNFSNDINSLIHDGLLWSREGRVGTTRDGTLVLNRLIGQLLA